MTAHEELFALAEKLKKAASGGEADDIAKPLSALEDSAVTVGRSFSGSWQGYHSCVYYRDFSPPPPGAHFSQEWGLMDTYASSHGSHGHWEEYDPEKVKAHIRKLAGTPDLDKAHTVADAASKSFEFAKAEIISVLQNEIEEHEDGFLENLKKEVEKLEPLSTFEVAQHLSPKGQFMTRDTIVLGQGPQVPPHMTLLPRLRAFATPSQSAMLPRALRQRRHHTWNAGHTDGESQRG